MCFQRLKVKHMLNISWCAQDDQNQMSVNPDHYKKENAFVKSYHLQIQIQE